MIRTFLIVKTSFFQSNYGISGTLDLKCPSKYLQKLTIKQNKKRSHKNIKQNNYKNLNKDLDDLIYRRGLT